MVLNTTGCFLSDCSMLFVLRRQRSFWWSERYWPAISADTWFQRKTGWSLQVVNAPLVLVKRETFLLFDHRGQESKKAVSETRCYLQCFRLGDDSVCVMSNKKASCQMDIPSFAVCLQTPPPKKWHSRTVKTPREGWQYRLSTSVVVRCPFRARALCGRDRIFFIYIWHPGQDVPCNVIHPSILHPRPYFIHMCMASRPFCPM